MKLIKLKVADYDYANGSSGQIPALWGLEVDGVCKYRVTKVRDSIWWMLSIYDENHCRFAGKQLGQFRTKALAVKAAEKLESE